MYGMEHIYQNDLGAHFTCKFWVNRTTQSVNSISQIRSSWTKVDVRNIMRATERALNVPGWFIFHKKSFVQFQPQPTYQPAPEYYRNVSSEA